MKLPFGLKFIFLLLFLAVLYLFVRRYQLQWQNDNFKLAQREINLPLKDYIAGYIQQEILDFDGDGKKEEAVAIYHDGGSEDKIYNAFFVIFKKKNDDWEKIFERHLGTYNLWDDRQTPAQAGKRVNKIIVKDLTGDGADDVLVEGKIEDGGSFLTVFVYSWKNNQVANIFQSEGLYQGKAGIEADKLWTIIGILDQGAEYFPSYWVKQWWLWQGSDFVPTAYWEDESSQKIESMTLEDALKKALEGLTDDKLKELAVNFLAGKKVRTATAIKDLSQEQKIILAPKAVNFQDVTMLYNPLKDEYILTNYKTNDAEEKIIKEVILEYEASPFQAKIQIDPVAKKVVGFSIGKG